MPKASENKIDKLELGINRISIFDFSYKEPEGEFEDFKKKLKIKINTFEEIVVDDDRVNVKIEIFYFLENENQEDENYVKLIVEISFTFIPLKDLVKRIKVNEQNTLVFKNKINAISLAGIAYSTVRGIMFEKLNGTIYNNISLPIVDPTNLLDSQNY